MPLLKVPPIKTGPLKLLSSLHKSSKTLPLKHTCWGSCFDLFFSHLLGSYWTTVTNRRAFLNTFAQKKGFDPLIADNWYKNSDLVNDKVITTPQTKKKWKKVVY